MKKPFYVAFAAALALLPGCIVYQMDKTPPCDGLSDAARAECKFKPKCLLSSETKVRIPRHPVWGKEMPNHSVYGSWTASSLVARQKDVVSTLIEESDLFAECQDDAVHTPTGDEVRIHVNCEYEYNHDEDALGQLAVTFSLGLYPGVCFEGTFRYEIAVDSGLGLKRKYRFVETVRERRGLFCAFAVVWGGRTESSDEAFASVNRKVMNNLLVKMQKDGFFSTEGRDKTSAAKADVVEAAKKTVAARRKELEDLKKAGIIDEAEYAAEVKKLEGAGK